MENPIEQINNIANMDDFLTFVVPSAMDASLIQHIYSQAPPPNDYNR